MKSALLTLFVVLVCSLAAAAQSWRDDRARLCFDRPEDNGSINTLQSWIHVADYDVPVSGGQAVCLYVTAPDSTNLTVTSTIPYEPSSRNTAACKSNALKLELSPNQNLTFTISPASDAQGYKCGWRIKQLRESH